MHRRRKSNILLLLCFLVPAYTAGQTEDGIDVQQVLESLPEEEETSDYTDLTYWLNHYREHPLNLNTATESELQNLALLNPLQIVQLQKHIDEHGKLISIYELQAVPGWDLMTIKSILPYVKASDVAQELPHGLKDAIKNGKHQIATRYSTTLEAEKGYDYPMNRAREFQGPAYSLLSRYQYRYRDKISLGITAEKDAGERFFGQDRDFDFYSGHAYYKGSGKLKALAVGDYQLQFGQGLVMWSAFAIGKTGDVASVARAGRGVLPSRSANESQFMRGAAATLGIGKWRFTPFVSSHKIDASMNLGPVDHSEKISSLLLSGYHRNETELSTRRNSSLSVAGLNTNFKTGTFTLGLTGTYTRYGHALDTGRSLYEFHEPTGENFHNLGIHYSWLYRNAYFFGESALAHNNTPALINGVVLSLHKQANVVVIHHYYDRAYFSPFANAFGVNTGNRNEQGIYMGLN